MRVLPAITPFHVKFSIKLLQGLQLHAANVPCISCSCSGLSLEQCAGSLAYMPVAVARIAMSCNKLLVPSFNKPSIMLLLAEQLHAANLSLSICL